MVSKDLQQNNRKCRFINFYAYIPDPFCSTLLLPWIFSNDAISFRDSKNIASRTLTLVSNLRLLLFTSEALELVVEFQKQITVTQGTRLELKFVMTKKLQEIHVLRFVADKLPQIALVRSSSPQVRCMYTRTPSCNMRFATYFKADARHIKKECNGPLYPLTSCDSHLLWFYLCWTGLTRITAAIVCFTSFKERSLSSLSARFSVWCVASFEGTRWLGHPCVTRGFFSFVARFLFRRQMIWRSSFATHFFTSAFTWRRITYSTPSI